MRPAGALRPHDRHPRVHALVHLGAWLTGLALLSCDGRGRPPGHQPSPSPGLATLAPPVTSSRPLSARPSPPPSLPCTPLVDWWGKVPEHASNCRAQGRLCQDMKEKPVESCSQGILERLVTFEQYDEFKKLGGPSGADERIRQAYVRGYLRRMSGHSQGRLVSRLDSEQSWVPSDGVSDPDASCGSRWIWSIALSQRADDASGCLLQPAGLSCYGDATVACCPQGVIDSDVEVALQPITTDLCIIGPSSPAPTPRLRVNDLTKKRLLD